MQQLYNVDVHIMCKCKYLGENNIKCSNVLWLELSFVLSFLLFYVKANRMSAFVHENNSYHLPKKVILDGISRMLLVSRCILFDYIAGEIMSLLRRTINKGCSSRGEGRGGS
jgi:cellulose synthase/poly-beta-1,6-N-acetylglucosamine synthase-like glycosyltransferase